MAFALHALVQLVNHLSEAEPIAPVTITPGLGGDGVFVPTDIREVVGQEHVSAVGGSIGDRASASGGGAGDTARAI